MFATRELGISGQFFGSLCLFSILSLELEVRFQHLRITNILLRRKKRVGKWFYLCKYLSSTIRYESSLAEKKKLSYKLFIFAFDSNVNSISSFEKLVLFLSIESLNVSSYQIFAERRNITTTNGEKKYVKKANKHLSRVHMLIN